MKIRPHKQAKIFAFILAFLAGAVSADPIEYYEIEEFARFDDWVSYKLFEKRSDGTTICRPTINFLAGNRLVQLDLLEGYKDTGEYTYYFFAKSPYTSGFELYLDNKTFGQKQHSFVSLVSKQDILKMTDSNHLEIKVRMNKHLPGMAEKLGWKDESTEVRTSISLNGLKEALQYCEIID